MLPISKIVSAASSLLPGKITQSLPFQFFTDPVSTVVGGLAKSLFTKSAARQAYEAALGTPAMLNYLTPSAMVRGASKFLEKGEKGGILPGGYVPGRLLRVGRENLLSSQKSGLASVLSPGRSGYSP